MDESYDDVPYTNHAYAESHPASAALQSAAGDLLAALEAEAAEDDDA